MIPLTYEYKRNTKEINLDEGKGIPNDQVKKDFEAWFAQ